MSDKTSLGDRMKGFYEAIPKTFLMRRTPVIIRIDGKAFHTFTRGMQRPFDEIMVKTMQDTTRTLCENIQGCVLGYTQSDEISLLLVDYKKLNSSAWFDYNVQKVVSVSASMATAAFNEAFRRNAQWSNVPLDDKFGKALFDSRAFNIPKEEVANYFIWRQEDATRNSIQSVGQANFSHSELKNKSCEKIQDMLFTEYGINWNNFRPTLKRGSCCYKAPVMLPGSVRKVWVVDPETPIFTQDREYIEQWVYPALEE